MWGVHVGVTEQPVHGAQSVAVERIVYHSKYRPKGLDYDIALMKLATPLQFNGNHEEETLPCYHSNKTLTEIKMAAVGPAESGDICF